MKRLLAGAAIAALFTSTVASATGTFHWRGKTDNLESGCFFTENFDGAMTLSKSKSGKLTYWYTTDPAEVKIMVRQSGDPYKPNIRSIMVEPVRSDGTTLGGSVWRVTNDGIQEWGATVSYRTNLKQGTRAVYLPKGWVLDYDKTIKLDDRITLTASSTARVDSGIVELLIGGIAVVVTADSDAKFDANADYTVSHLTTCLQ